MDISWLTGTGAAKTHLADAASELAPSQCRLAQARRRGPDLLVRNAQLILHDPGLVRLPIVQHPALELIVERLDGLPSATGVHP